MSIDRQIYSTLLVDTNIIIETHKVRSWNVLVNRYRVETVEDCVTEAHSGYLRRPESLRIDPVELRTQLRRIHTVEDNEYINLEAKIKGIDLDLGEKSLWAHALGRDDCWILCGPDKSSLRCGVRLGFLGRLVSLEKLLDNVGHHPRPRLRDAYTERWHRRLMGEIAIDEL